MAKQGMERREVLRIMALASAASKFPGFFRWAFAGTTHLLPQASRQLSGNTAYQPRFFSAEEYKVVERLSEVIIPSDRSPGAREAGVSEFIDFMVTNDHSIQFRFRYGLRWMEAHARRLYGKSLLKISTSDLTKILEHLANKDRYRDGESEGRALFKLIRDYTVMGFYTSRVGLEALDCPALQRYYPDSPRCPHASDSDHQHLPRSHE